MNKKNIITIFTVLLVLQAALIAYLYRPGQTHSAPAIALMDTLDVNSVSSVVITNENGGAITLQKKDKEWLVGDQEYPAEQTSIQSIINKISGLESARLVSRTKSSHNRLKVGDTIFNRKIVLSSEGGNSVTFFMGTAPSSKSVHLRLSGQNEVYQVAGISAWELQPEKDSWWQNKYVSLESDSIQGVNLTNSNGTINLRRDADATKWQFEENSSTKLDQEKASALIGTISNISIAEYLNKDFTTADKPICTIEYLLDKDTVSLQIWPKSDDNEDHVAKLSNAAFYAKIRAYIIKEALDVTSQRLVTEEPVLGPSSAPVDGQ